MYQYYWTGTYSFKNEIGLFAKAIKEFFEDVLKKIDEVEKLTA